MKRFIPVAALVLVSCAPGAASRAVVELDEFTITPSAVTFQTGEVELMVSNQGEFGHTLVVTDPAGDVVWAGDLLEPAEEETVRLDLPPGEYQLTCRIVAQDGDGNLIDHYERGMVAWVSVESA